METMKKTPTIHYNDSTKPHIHIIIQFACFESNVPETIISNWNSKKKIFNLLVRLQKISRLPGWDVVETRVGLLYHYRTSDIVIKCCIIIVVYPTWYASGAMIYFFFVIHFRLNSCWILSLFHQSTIIRITCTLWIAYCVNRHWQGGKTEVTTSKWWI